jgi:hypothetical protein
MELTETQSTSKQPRQQWRLFAGLGAIVLLNVLIFVVVATLSAPQPVAAQGDGGDDDDDKLTPIDFYPSRFEEGAMAYSLRDPWPKTDLTFYFINCPSRLDCNAAHNAIRGAFQEWATVSALTFREVNNVAEADIEVTFTANDPEGVLGTVGDVLAYNYFPRYGGDMFIDDAEPWTIGGGGDFDLIMTAIHEIGHGIGLDHSEYKEAIMYPYAGFATGLADDDIQAVQELYGPPPGPDTTVEADVEGPREPLGTIDLTVNASATEKGTVSDDTPYNIWNLDVAAGTTVTVTMYQASGNLDPYIGILTEDLSTVLVENDNWNGDNARVVYTFEAGGRYKIVATRFDLEGGDTSGTYNLTIETTAQGQPPAEAPPAPQTITWRITNFSDVVLCEIYFSPTSSPTWGENQIVEVDPLQDGFYYEWQQPPDSYDVQVWDCLGNSLEFYDINATRNVDVQIYQNRIDVSPLNPGADAATAPDDAPTVLYQWRVSNYADVPLCGIYFSPTIDDTWSLNQISDVDPLQAGFYYEWELAPDTYDIRVEDCSEGFLELYEITLAQDTELAISNDNIQARPLE